MNHNLPTPKAGILDIKPYVPGKSGADGVKVHKLSSNESPIGASPKALKAFAEAASKITLYPDGNATQLRNAIAKRFGLAVGQIVCGNGSDEILQMLAHAYIDHGDEVIYSQFGFNLYPILIASNGGIAVVAPEKNFAADVDAILLRVTAKTKMVFLANPNNPTGTYLSFSEVKRLHSSLPHHVVLVLDAAYAEFIRNNDYEAGIALVSESQNVVMTRTFSKIHGLASLRLGWAYAPLGIADVLNRIRGPFNVSLPAAAAGAAAIEDAEFVEAAFEHNQKWLPWLEAELKKLGLEVTPSVGNFVLTHFRSVEAAQKADAFLQSKNIIVRRMESYHLPTALRVSVGNADANYAVVAALKEHLS